MVEVGMSGVVVVVVVELVLGGPTVDVGAEEGTDGPGLVEAAAVVVVVVQVDEVGVDDVGVDDVGVDGVEVDEVEVDEVEDEDERAGLWVVVVVGGGALVVVVLVEVELSVVVGEAVVDVTSTVD